MRTDELEQELGALATPRVDDDRLRRTIRGALAAEAQGRRRPARPGRLAFAVGALATATVAAVVALIGTGGSGGPASANAAILAHMVRAASPPNMIVHIRETGTLDDGKPVSVEWWQETSAPHALRLIKGPVGHEGEGGSNGTTAFQYDAATNTIYQRPEAGVPSLVDPVETVRAALSDGTAQIAGTVTIDGRTLYKVVLPNGVVGYFDRTDYRPVFIDNPQGGGGVVRTTVTAYEELPPTPANEQLLNIAAQHPGARVVDGAPPEPTKASGDTK
jgi:hypothetical protein